jgi:hypothetical protein
MKYMNKGSELAIREYMLDGHPITALESTIMFGVNNPGRAISRLRHDGFVINRKNITYSAVLARLNKVCTLVPPANTPIKELRFSEWWMQR